MRVVRVLALLLGGFALAASGCGRKSHSLAVHGGAARPAPAPPTPDNTPIASLRTPAGWLLVKAERTAATPTPAASAATSPRP